MCVGSSTGVLCVIVCVYFIWFATHLGVSATVFLFIFSSFLSSPGIGALELHPIEPHLLL